MYWSCIINYYAYFFIKNILQWVYMNKNNKDDGENST